MGDGRKWAAEREEEEAEKAAEAREREKLTLLFNRVYDEGAEGSDRTLKRLVRGIHRARELEGKLRLSEKPMSLADHNTANDRAAALHTLVEIVELRDNKR